MVKPADPEAKPRRDGYLERIGTWGEVTVGSLLASSLSRTTRWRVIATAHPTQIEYAKTLWFRMRDESTGEEVSVEPRLVNTKVVFLMESDSEVPPPRQPAEDAEKIALLVEALGAQEIATLDHATGEVHCPNYAESYLPGQGIVDELEHLRLCHNMDTRGLEAVVGTDERIRAISRAHGESHARNAAAQQHGVNGFPHRHVPEDHSTL